MSDGLSERLSQLNIDGRHLNDDSRPSEETLNGAMREIIPYAKELFQTVGATVKQIKSMSLYECQQYFHKVGGPSPNPDNKNVSMKPDGGILMVTTATGETFPILIVEDKVQGTNDNLFKQNKKKQATGNAIERGAKNIRGAEMLFADRDIFPYVLFASGCDFHSSETIAKRIEMMNMGVPNHYIEVKPTTSSEMIATTLAAIISAINIKKICGKSIASVFVKAHKWNEMSHGSSKWKKNEIVQICKQVIDKVFMSVYAPAPATLETLETATLETLETATLETPTASS
jgi:hypothetical protein